MKLPEGFTLETAPAETFLAAGALDALAPEVSRVADDLERHAGPGADFLGWLDPEAACPADVRARIRQTAAHAREDCSLFIVIGIGGSYLGARAILEALPARQGGPEVVFAGTDLCAAGLRRVLARARDAELRICVISKSGTTLEPAIAFRALRALAEERYGREEAGRRIPAITDARSGVLRRMADEKGWETFVVPDDVGGRFSVLTAVGLLPLAVGGVDVEAMVGGAAAMRRACSAPELRDNPAHLYAAARHALYERGFRIEILSAFHCDLRWLQEWWKQLFAESEGKQGRGIFPAAATLTTDLHSIGQYIQEGRRDLFETFLCVRNAAPGVTVPALAEEGAGAPAAAGDGLGYLVGRSLDEINARAYAGTR